MTKSTEEYFEQIYGELRLLAIQRLALESNEESLHPSALIHEAFLRLQKIDQVADTIHFKALAARAMQRVLVDRARKRKSQKRGAGARPVPLVDLAETWHQPELALEIHELLDAFEKRSPRKAELIRLRVYGGYKLIEAAEILGISNSTAEDDWAFATAWLRREWKKGDSDENQKS